MTVGPPPSTDMALIRRIISFVTTERPDPLTLNVTRHQKYVAQLASAIDTVFAEDYPRGVPGAVLNRIVIEYTEQARRVHFSGEKHESRT
jgi:hypothetical protein